MENFRNLERESGTSAYEREKAIQFVEELLMEIDVDLIRDIFAELLQKSGVKLSEKHSLPEEVEVVYMATNIKGSHYKGHITINARHVPLADTGIAAASVLSSYIHELAHFYSVENQNHTKNVSGYRLNTGDVSASTLLDEAVTELIADQVFREYVKRSGNKARLLTRRGDLGRMHRM